MKRMAAAVVAALAIPVTAGVASADTLTLAGKDKPCDAARCIAKVKSQEEKVTRTSTPSPSVTPTSGSPVLAHTPPSGGSTAKKYDRESAMAEWRERDPGAFDPITGMPSGPPPCDVFVIPYVYESCEGNEPEPAEPATTVTIEQVISMAMAQITLPKPAMGSAPCTDAECKGTVGVPVWFWLEGNQWKTYQDSASAGGLSVTVTAKPSQVVWDLGDGQTVTCTNAGTAYDAGKGWASSPDCGVPGGYTRAGDYTISASITYDVTISGDATGTDTVTRTSTADVTVGEYQSVVSSHGTN
ncbi:hypothetical protein [Janibacter anophelis]|uniref:hypothetical protein n=1 Tax=Janibacter anophelis TaxID=319054 RepID=UPI00082E840B|nr:hypothetical protein [Janibacter anophelis]